jgi:flagellar FliJ protein
LTVAHKFTFKLEAVLEQRKHVERQRQREVADAQQRILSLQAELDALAAVKRASAKELRHGALTPATLAAHQRFAAATRQKGVTLHRSLAHARHELAAAQDVLLEAAKQRKVMEKLRDREQQRWAEQMRRRELAEADEIAAARRAHAAAASRGGFSPVI